MGGSLSAGTQSSREVAGSSPYGWLPTRTVGNGPSGSTLSSAQAAAGSTARPRPSTSLSVYPNSAGHSPVSTCRAHRWYGWRSPGSGPSSSRSPVSVRLTWRSVVAASRPSSSSQGNGS